MSNPYDGQSATQSTPGISGENTANGTGVSGVSSGPGIPPVTGKPVPVYGTGVSGSSEYGTGVSGSSNGGVGVSGKGSLNWLFADFSG
jgi:hypothetical protein